MSEGRCRTRPRQGSRTRIPSRRNILLGGTTLAAASALGGGAPSPGRAGASASPAAAVGPAEPNILVIFGDDIGQTNISAYTFGVMGYRTPNIDRIAKEGMMFTDYYAEQSCTAGRSSFITGQATLRTGLSKVGLPGADLGLQRRGHDHRRGAQAARLRDRPIRQEPSRRQERVPADGARLRRVLRQPLSPQRRGGAGESRLSEGPPFQGALRAARRAQVQGDRPRRSDRSIRASARSASRPSRTPAR